MSHVDHFIARLHYDCHSTERAIAEHTSRSSRLRDDDNDVDNDDECHVLRVPVHWPK